MSPEQPPTMAKDSEVAVLGVVEHFQTVDSLSSQLTAREATAFSVDCAARLLLVLMRAGDSLEFAKPWAVACRNALDDVKVGRTPEPLVPPTVGERSGDGALAAEYAYHHFCDFLAEMARSPQRGAAYVASKNLDVIELLLDDAGDLDIRPNAPAHPLLAAEMERQRAWLLDPTSRTADVIDLYCGRWF